MEDDRQNDGSPWSSLRPASFPWYPYESPKPGSPPQASAATSIPWSSSRRPGSLPQGSGEWSSGLCDCSEDCGNCWLTFFCPCITFGRIAEIVDRGSSSCDTRGAMYALIALTGCQCLYSCTYRKKLRAHYALPESPCNDCLVHCCCEPCALCQAYRELENRDFGMALGWHGSNKNMQGIGMIKSPPIQGAMTR